MRKEYNKPALFAESFEICEHITRTCNAIAGIGGIATHWDESSCGFRTGGPDTGEAIVFNSEPTCDNPAEWYEGEDVDFIIYHGSQGPTSVSLSAMFSS